jgi:hypothetical protein
VVGLLRFQPLQGFVRIVRTVLSRLLMMRAPGSTLSLRLDALSRKLRAGASVQPWFKCSIGLAKTRAHGGHRRTLDGRLGGEGAANVTAQTPPPRGDVQARSRAPSFYLARVDSQVEVAEDSPASKASPTPIPNWSLPRRVQRGIDRLAADFASGNSPVIEQTIQDLRLVQQELARSAKLSIGFSGSAGDRAQVRSHVARWTTRAPAAPAVVPAVPPPSGRSVGFAAGLDVAQCCRALQAPGYEAPTAAALSVATAYFWFNYLVDEIRLRGAAYSTWCDDDPIHHVLTLGSVSDPQVARTATVCLSTEVAAFVGIADRSTERASRPGRPPSKHEGRGPARCPAHLPNWSGNCTAGSDHSSASCRVAFTTVVLSEENVEGWNHE